MAITFTCLSAMNLECENIPSQVSNEAKNFIAFMRQNRFKDLFACPEAYYNALKREEAIQRSLPSRLENYPLPFFVRDCVNVQVASTSEGAEYLTLSPKDEEPVRAILYVCGGGFMSQPMESHWDMICHLVHELSCKVAVSLHPLLPNFSYEQARGYLLSVYKDVLANNAEVALAGDSSGGWCALAIALWAKEHGIDQPGKIVLISPLLDLSNGNAEMREALSQHDEMLSPWGIAEAGCLWTPNFHDKKTWPPSPVFASLQDIAPIDIVIGGNEMLIADLRLLQGTSVADHVRAAVYSGMWHAFPLFAAIPESMEARSLIVESIRQHWAESKQ